jgi:hypothetical protein
MGKTYPRLNDKLIAFIKAQRMFFVATAPLSADGHVNVSPKGYDSFAVIDASTVAYLDLGGSGIETVAHLKENGRITLMFCAFEGRANIVRIYGQGEATTLDQPDFPALRALFAERGRARSVIKIKVERVSDSCGWGVPFYDFKGERDQLKAALAHPTDQVFRDKFYEGNATSIDGLPGMQKPADLFQPSEL